MVKTIMQSTADDTGMDGLSQGHGVINAFAAVDFILNDNGYTFYTYDSVEHWAAATEDAWLDDMNPYDKDAFINTTYPPIDFADGNLYFGLVAPAATSTVELEGANWIYTDMTYRAEEYVVDTVTTFTFETYVFNETTSLGHDTLKGGWFELDTLLGGNYGNFQNAPYATISITGAQDEVGLYYVGTTAVDPLWAFVFNWDDSNVTNGRVDYYNPVTGQGDELTRLQYAGGTGNILKMDLSHPDGLGNLFPQKPIVLVNDNTIFSSWHAPGDGHTLDVTVTTWKLQTDGNIGFAANVDNCDVTVTAPSEYGIHQGFVMVNGTTKIPYSYMVYATYDTAGTVMELAEGFGTVQTPYENGAVTAGWDSYYTGRSADHLSFVVDLTDATVNFLAARINWTNAESDLDVAIIDITGAQRAYSGDAVKSTTTSSLAIYNVTAKAPGMYVIYVSVNELEGPVPEVFTLTVVGLTSIAEPTLELSWTSREHPSPTVITAGGSAVGDHVMMTATWTDAVNPGMPEFAITTMEMKILYGNLFEATGACPQGVPDPSGALRESPVNPDYFAWETAPGILEGDVVRIVVDFDGADVDALVWWADVPMNTRTMANSIAGNAMATGDIPQVYTFTATRDGDLAVAILDWQQDGSHYWLSVDNRVGLEPDPAAGKTFTMDSYDLLANGTFSVLVGSDTGSNIRYSMEMKDIFLGNFFAPDLTVNSAVSLGSNLYNFTWSASDQNEDDSLFYSIGISSDGGATFQLVASNLTETFFVWSAAGWLEGDYYFRVRAYSFDTVYLLDGEPLGTLDAPPSSYGPYVLFTDVTNGPFAAGDVPVPTSPTTTTTTTTTTPTPTEPPVFDPLLIGLIGGIGVGVVVLLILFLIRKK
jgi:hypothetical protein